MNRSSISTEIKDCDGHTVQLFGTVQIRPLLQTVARLCRVLNIKAIAMTDNNDELKPNHASAGEIVFLNPFLLCSGLDVKVSNANWLQQGVWRSNCNLGFVLLRCERR